MRSVRYFSSSCELGSSLRLSEDFEQWCHGPERPDLGVLQGVKLIVTVFVWTLSKLCASQMRLLSVILLPAVVAQMIFEVVVEYG